MKKNPRKRHSNRGHGKSREPAGEQACVGAWPVGGACEGTQRRQAPDHRALNMLVDGDFILKAVGGHRRV